mmetsp:Transcript_35217/g.63493  ORF Transcript_35217/g.63493 Transcript_35217/m.63493 type:complete len:432 (-) Transcript_35217:247-1542(-)
MIGHNWNLLVCWDRIGDEGCRQNDSSIHNLLYAADGAVVLPDHDNASRIQEAYSMEIRQNQRRASHIVNLLYVYDGVPVPRHHLGQDDDGRIRALIQLQTLVAQRLHEAVQADDGPSLLLAANSDAVHLCVSHNAKQYVTAVSKHGLWRWVQSECVLRYACSELVQSVELLLGFIDVSPDGRFPHETTRSSILFEEVLLRLVRILLLFLLLFHERSRKPTLKRLGAGGCCNGFGVEATRHHPFLHLAHDFLIICIRLHKEFLVLRCIFSLRFELLPCHLALYLLLGILVVILLVIFTAKSPLLRISCWSGPRPCQLRLRMFCLHLFHVRHLSRRFPFRLSAEHLTLLSFELLEDPSRRFLVAPRQQLASSSELHDRLHVRSNEHPGSVSCSHLNPVVRSGVDEHFSLTYLSSQRAKISCVCKTYQVGLLAF